MNFDKCTAIIEKLSASKKKDRELRNVYWVAAGGSYGGFYPAQYLMEHESTTIQSGLFTSNEFVHDTPRALNSNSLVVLCSMRGTKETCDAAEIAKKAGAPTVGLYIEPSHLTEICDYSIKYESVAEDASAASEMNASYGLMLAFLLLKKYNSYQYFDDAIHGFQILDSIYKNAWEYTLPLAREWANQNKDEKIIWVLAGGPLMGAGYIFSICNLEEMQWISSPTINTSEFVHGPFECVDKNLPVFILLNAGKTRTTDIRALNFLKTHGGKKVYILDAKEIGLTRINRSVGDYFHHLIYSPILNNVYLRALSEAKQHDWHFRRYMWKEEY